MTVKLLVVKARKKASSGLSLMDAKFVVPCTIASLVEQTLRGYVSPGTR